MIVLRKIKRYQKSIDFLISKIIFQRLIREIVMKMKIDIRFQMTTMIILQKVVEIFVIMIFQN